MNGVDSSLSGWWSEEYLIEWQTIADGKLSMDCELIRGMYKRQIE